MYKDYYLCDCGSIHKQVNPTCYKCDSPTHFIKTKEGFYKWKEVCTKCKKEVYLNMTPSMAMEKTVPNVYNLKSDDKEQIEKMFKGIKPCSLCK